MENQMYSVASGSMAMGGNTYVAHLVALYAIRGAHSKTQDVWIATDVEHFRSFDDIVIVVRDRDTGIQEVLLLQCKHSYRQKKIPVVCFFKPTRPMAAYNLQKCYNDYTRITKTASFTDPLLSSIYGKIQEDRSRLRCVLFINDMLEESCMSILEKSSCDFFNTVGQVFSFKLEGINKMNEKFNCHFEINEEFSNHLLLFSNQIHNRKMCSFIIDELIKVLHPIKIPRYTLHDLVKTFTAFIMEWSKGELGGSYMLTKTHTITKLTELLLERYMSQFYTNKFNTTNNTSGCNFEEWHSLIQHKNIIEFFVSYEENDKATDLLHGYFDWLLQEYKVYQRNYPTTDWEQEFTSQGRVKFFEVMDTAIHHEMLRTLGSDNDITLYHVYRVLWKVKKIPVILEVSTRRDYDAVLHILSLSDYTLKCIILNTSNNQVLPTLKMPDTFSSLIDLEKNAYELVLEKEVELQGRLIKLKDLLERQSRLVKIIGAMDVMHILTGNFKIGNTINKLPIDHVVRTIPRILINVEMLFGALDDTADLFIIQCFDKSSFFECLNALNVHSDKCVVVDYENINYMNKIPNNCKIILMPYSSILLNKDIADRNIHHLILHNSHTLEWVTTKGSIKNIYSMKDTSPYSCTNTPPINAQDALGHFQNRVNIISAVPGMGKSVMISYISQTAPTDMWILLVNLNQHLDYYGSEQFKLAASDPVTYLHYFNQFSLNNEQMNSSVGTEAFTAFLTLKAVLILLDGFDEVPQYYRESVTDMIKSFVAKGYRIWLTTRPDFQSFLEKEFDTFAIVLNGFSRSDQRNFLIQYFSHITVTETEFKESIPEFAEQLLQSAQRNLNDWEQEFTAVPLHMRLLAECFENDYRNYLKTKKLDKNFNLLNLYEIFTLKKITISQEKFGPYGDKILFDEYHQLFSLQALFSVEDLEELQIDLELARFKNMEHEAVEVLSKTGIVVRNELSLDFSHRSFAEYFAAKWLSVHFKNPNVRKLINKMFQSQYSVTRKIFDQLLAKNCPLHVAIIHQQIDEARALIEQEPELLNTRDAGGRLPIHLVAAWGTRHPMPKSREMIDPNVHECEDNNFHINVFLKKICTGMKEFMVDDVLEFTPLNYAVISDSLSNLDAILSTITFSSPVAISKSKVKHYMYYCSRYAYKSLTKRILQAYSLNQLHFYINYPLDKTFKRTAVHWASTMGHKNIMNLLLFPTAPNDITHKQERDALITSILCKTDVSKQTALHLAVKNKHTAMVALLLSLGASINTTDQQYQTPLHVAAHNGSADILNLLLDESNVNAQDTNGNTALHLIALRGHQDLLFMLLNREENITLRNNKGETSLHLATKKEHIDVMQSLLKHNSKVIDEHDNSRNTALHVAAECGHTRAVKLLLSLGADQNIINCENKVALHLAAAHGHPNVVALLIPKTDINIRDGEGNTPLHLAALHNHKSTVSELLSCQANINEQNYMRRTALHESALKNSKTVANFLLESGVNLEQRDESNRTALHLAALYNSSDMLELLLRKNMNPNDKDIDGNTCLHLAVLKGQLQVVTALLKDGREKHSKVNINQTNDRHRTALHLAAEVGNYNIAKVLLSHGANTELTDKDGNTVVDLANMNNCISIATLCSSTETDIFI